MPDTLDSSTLSNGGGVGGGGVCVCACACGMCVCVCESMKSRGKSRGGIAERAEENAALKAQQNPSIAITIYS